MGSFCEYLLQKGRITESQYTEAKSRYEKANLNTGLCAYAFGFLDQWHIGKVLDVQRRSGGKFGEIAVSLGFLEPAQLRTVLRIQQKYRVSLERALIDDGAISQEELDHERRLFMDASKTDG